MLASASEAIIIGFQVRPSADARRAAEREGVEINTYSIIYDAIDDVKQTMQGMLDKVKKEVISGEIEVKQVFKISKVGTVAGGLVTDGKVHNKDKARVIRDGIVIHTAPIDALKRYKDDAKEVATGLECGISLVNFNDIQVGDAEQKYEFGFTTDVHTEIIPVGLNEDIVRLISAKKGEPEWMLEFRLKAFRYWQEQTEPKWGHVHVPPIDYQAISYYADPMASKPKGDGKIDPELEKTFDKLGIPLEERLALSGNTAVDAIMDSVSVKTTFKEKLREKGVIFCSIGEAIKEHPDLVREYLGSVVPYRDNYFAALNSAVFSDGSFVYIPKGVRCPMELSSYFRINARNTGQFERTLIIADDDAYVSYLEGMNRVGAVC